MLSSLVAGLTLGLSVAMPFGPVSLICVQRSVTGGYRSGLVAGMGAASAQGIFATAALAGRTVVSSELLLWNEPLRWLSAGLLLWLGLRTLLRRGGPAAPAARPGARMAYLSSLALALSNPMTILPYIALATGVTAAGGAGVAFTSWSIPGVIAGSCAWYALLSGGASTLRMGMPAWFNRVLNSAAGGMLILFGIWVALR